MSDQPQPEHDPVGSFGSLMIGLLYEDVPAIDRNELLERIRAYNGNTEIASADNEDMLHFVYPDHLWSVQEGDFPAQTVILNPQHTADLTPDPFSLSQTFDWPEATQIVPRARTMLMVTDMMSYTVERQTRLALIHGALQAILDLTPVLAIHWFTSQRYVNPDEYLAARDEGDPLYPAVNVRMFRIEDQAPGELIMDTVGLARLGLPDLQCHFTGIEPGQVAGLLYGYADYLFANGNVIEDGHTVQGVDPESRWLAHHEIAVVKPEREVIDLDPGDPYAAGNRG